MSNIFKKEFYVNSSFIMEGGRVIKLANADLLKKDTVFKGVANPTPQVQVTQQVEEFNPTSAVQPTSQMQNPLTEERPSEIYNPAPQAPQPDLNAVVDDANKPIGTPTGINQNVATEEPKTNVIDYLGSTTAPTNENMFDKPNDAKVIPFPGTTSEDEVKKLKEELLKKIEASIDEFLKGVIELKDNKVSESAISGLNQVSDAIVRGEEILRSSYQPEETVISRV